MVRASGSSMRMKNVRMAICGSGGFSRGMEVALQSRQVLDKHSLKSCEHNLNSRTRQIPKTRAEHAHPGGRDPRSPEGDLARKQAGKMGSRPAMKRFLPRTVLVLFHRSFLGLQVLIFPLVRTGCRTRYRTILGNSRSAMHSGFASENVVVTGQEMGAEPPVRCHLVRSQEGL